MVCIHLSRYTIPQHANNTQVYIPINHPISNRIGHRQRPPVTFPQTELDRWPQRNNTHELAYQVLSSRESAQDGQLVVVAREDFTVCP